MFGLNVSEYDCVCNCERGVSSYDVSVRVVSVVSVVSFVRVEGVFVRECANLCFCLCLSMYMCFFFSLVPASASVKPVAVSESNY